MSDVMKLTDAQLGDTVAGFVLDKKESVPVKKGVLYTLHHAACGAKLLYFDRPDPNKTFAVTFKTLPENDTGVFHILEHSVLNGSRKYPVKEPFVFLLQSSMQTFLNAMTYSDKTMFPVSSRNEQDLFNLMSVYLDAVFCPSIYEKPEIFMQEGWHYEFDEETGEVSYNGVVFNEMKGAYADVDDMMDEAASQLMYPDNSYGYSSGGLPEKITDLSYEQFLNTHRRFYHPTNSYFILDGHMSVEKVLSYIDSEYLSKYDFRQPDFDFRLQTPVTGKTTVYFEPSQEEDERAHMSLSKLLCTYEDREKIYAAKILAGCLTDSNEAPLTRAFLENGLAESVSLHVDGNVYQPGFTLMLRNTHQEQFDKIPAFVAEEARRLAKEGLDHASLRAHIERLAFKSREIQEPYGVNLADQIMSSWLYGGDPLARVDTAAVFDSLRQKLDTDYFEQLLLEMLGDASDKCIVYALASKTKVADDVKREKEKLAAVTALWDEEKRRQEQQATEKMQQWQQTPDDEAATLALPKLRLSDVSRDVDVPEAMPCQLADRPAIHVDLNSDGIVYLSLLFDVSDLTVEELRLLDLSASCLSKLPTASHTVRELQNIVKANTGILYGSVSPVSSKGDLHSCTTYLKIHASMLQENIPTVASLLGEIMTTTNWAETDKIGKIIAQLNDKSQQMLINNGISFACMKANSGYTAENAMREALTGESNVRWLSQLAGSFKDEQETISEKMAALAKRVFVSDRLLVAVGGDGNTAALEEMIRALPHGTMGAPLDAPEGVHGNQAVEIPTDVGFSALGGNLPAFGYAYTGPWSVLSSLLTFSYLWGAVRVQGGAYGTGMNVSSNGDMFCYSFRDPNMQNTAEVFSHLADALEEILQQPMSMDELIIGVINSTDPLQDPSYMFSVCCLRYLTGKTKQDVLRYRHEMLDTTVEDLKALIPALRTFAEKGCFCAVGNHDAVAFVKEAN